MAGVRFGGWIIVYFVTTVLTNVTGFGFPFATILPSHIVGGVSLVVLPVAIAALYWKHLKGAWRSIFVVTAVFALYLNVFVLVVQMFQKIPSLNLLAPTQKERPFQLAQGAVLVVFVAWGILAGLRF